MAQVFRIEAWLIVIPQNQQIMGCTVRICRRDDAVRQQAHNVEDAAAHGRILGGRLVDQHRIGVILPVGGDDARLVARVVETVGCQGLVS